MSKMNQKDAVFQAMTNVVGKFEGKCEPTKEQRAQVNSILFEGFRDERIELDKVYDDKTLKTYCSGLQSNWLRKDNRLNGGIAYVPKNPGSRSGSGDAQVKAMRQLLTTVESSEGQKEIREAIDARLAEIKPATVAKELSSEQIELLKSLGFEHLVPTSS